MVAPCLAAMIGWMVGTWDVENTMMRFVCVAIAVAQV